MPDTRIVMITESGGGDPSGTEEDQEESLEDLEKTILSLCSEIELRARRLESGKPSLSHVQRDKSEAQDEQCFPCTLSPINRQQQEVAVVTPINHSWTGQTQSTPHTDMPHCPPYRRRGLVYPSGPDLEVPMEEGDTFPGSDVYDDGLTYDQLLAEVSRMSGKSLPSSDVKNKQQLSKIQVGEIIAASVKISAPDSPQHSDINDVHNVKYFAQPSVASEMSVAGRFTGIQKSRHTFDESSIDQEQTPSADILGLEKFVCNDKDDEGDEDHKNRTETTMNQIFNQTDAADGMCQSKSELQSVRKADVCFASSINTAAMDGMQTSNTNFQSLKEPGELSSTASEKESESDSQISPVKTHVHNVTMRKRKLSKIRDSEKEEGELSTTTDDMETDGDLSSDADNGVKEDVTFMEKTLIHATLIDSSVEKIKSTQKQFASPISIEDCRKNGAAGSAHAKKDVPAFPDIAVADVLSGVLSDFSNVASPVPREAAFDCTKVDAVKVASDVISKFSCDVGSKIVEDNHNGMVSGEFVPVSPDSFTSGTFMSEKCDTHFVTLSETYSDVDNLISGSPRSVTDHDDVSINSPQSESVCSNVSVKSRSPQSVTDHDDLSVKLQQSVSSSDDATVKSRSPQLLTDHDLSVKSPQSVSEPDHDDMSVKSRSSQSVTDHDDLSVKSRSPQSVTDHDDLSVESRSPPLITDHGDFSVKSRSPQSVTDHGDLSVKSRSPQSVTDHEDLSVKSAQSGSDCDDVLVESRSTQSLIYHNGGSEESISKDLSSPFHNDDFVLSLTEDEDDVVRVLLGCSDECPFANLEETKKCLLKLDDDCEVPACTEPQLIAESFVVIDSPVKPREESFLIIDDPLKDKYPSVIGNECKTENMQHKKDHDNHDNSSVNFDLIEAVMPNTGSALISSRDKDTVCEEKRVKESEHAEGNKVLAVECKSIMVKMGVDGPVVTAISPVGAPKANTDSAAVASHNNVSAKEKKTLKVEHETYLMKSCREKWNSRGIQRPDENLTFSSWFRNNRKEKKSKGMHFLEGNSRTPPLFRDTAPENLDSADTCDSPKLKKRRTDKSPHTGGTNSVVSDLQQQLSEIEKEQKDLAQMLSQQHEFRIKNMKKQHAQYYHDLRNKQTLEKQQFYHTNRGFVVPAFLEYQLMLFDREHAAQVQQLEVMNRIDMNKLLTILDQENRVQAERFEILKEPKRQVLKTFTQQPRASKAQMETDAPHATVELWKGPCKINQGQKSLVQVCLPTDIAAFMIREDEIYDAHYVY